METRSSSSCFFMCLRQPGGSHRRTGRATASGTASAHPLTALAQIMGPELESSRREGRFAATICGLNLKVPVGAPEGTVTLVQYHWQYCVLQTPLPRELSDVAPFWRCYFSGSTASASHPKSSPPQGVDCSRCL